MLGIENGEDPCFAHTRRNTLRRKKDRISHASGIHASALAMGVTPFAGMVRSVVGFAVKLGLILAEVCLMVLSLLLFDVVMAVLV
jgi:hypothetical protein